MRALRHSGGDSDGLDDENAWLQRIGTPTSLDKNIGDDGDSTLVDLIGDDAPSPEESVLESDKEMIIDPTRPSRSPSSARCRSSLRSS